MNIKTLLGDRIIVLPDNSDEKTDGGIIIPEHLRKKVNPIKSGVIVKKGTGTPWNRMEDIHVKERVCWHNGEGQPYEEVHEDGHIAQYLILKYNEILFT